MKDEGCLLFNHFTLERSKRKPTIFVPNPRERGQDILQFCRLKYNVLNYDEVYRRLSTSKKKGINLDEAGKDRLFFSWTERKKSRFAFGRRDLAHLELTQNGLVVETMSKVRMKAVQALINEITGQYLKLQDMETKDGESALRECEARTKTPDFVSPQEAEIPPDVKREIERKMIEEWLHTKIPALNNKTPLQARRSTEGRRLLEELFQYMERMDRDVRRRGFKPSIDTERYRVALIKKE